MKYPFYTTHAIMSLKDQHVDKKHNIGDTILQPVSDLWAHVSFD